MATLPVIEVADLAAKLSKRESVVLADCRFDLSAPQAGHAAYRKGHLPGAHYLPLEHDLAAPLGVSGGRHPVPDAEAFAKVMRRIGLDAGKLLVAYDEGSHAYASRLWWLARYFGHADVVVLSGGLAAWTRAGHALDARTPPLSKGRFTPRIRAEMRVDIDALRGEGRRPLLVDARDARRYAGVEEPIDPRAGHIPGALNMPWQALLAGDGRLLDAEAQRARWQSICERDPSPVVYCGSGVTACVNLLGLELAGFGGARLYPGSWSDWCQHDGPVATGDAPS